jgi:DNA-binding MarR family transcriptional regulator
MDQDLADALVQTAFATTAVLTRVAAEHDLSLTQLRVFGILEDRRVRMTRLAEFLGLEKSTMSGLVDRAEKRGLLRRVPSADDGRAVDVEATPEGAALAARVRARVTELLAPLVDGTSPADRAELMRLLGGVTASFLP